MSVVTLPDLNTLPADALRALILAQHQHEQLLSTESTLSATQEQLQSREREIEHLKLLLAKLHRMQFGRKSEKLTRQIEQLELRLEELESKRSEQEPDASAAPLSPPPSTPTAAKPTRRALPGHLPRQTQRHEPKETACPQCQGELRKLGEDVSEDAGVRARQLRGDTSRAHQAELHEVRLHCAGRSAESSDRAGHGRAGAAGARSGE
jgi:transposase